MQLGDMGTNATGHVASTTAIVLSWFGYLPPVLTALASALASIWYAISIYNSARVQLWLTKRRQRRAQKLIDKAKWLQAMSSQQTSHDGE